MLVLTRKSNQSIMIGDDIEVTVLAIMGEKVRIGIQASREVPVFRKEVYLEIKQEQLREAEAADADAAAAADANGTNPAATAAQGREQVDAALRTLEESK